MKFWMWACESCLGSGNKYICTLFMIHCRQELQKQQRCGVLYIFPFPSAVYRICVAINGSLNK